MKRVCFLMVGLSSLLLAGAAQADAELAKAKLCTGCHKVDQKMVGPAYQEVAKKYAGDAGAEAKLIKSIKAGSKDVWGPVAMPANANVSDAEAKTLAKWVLSLK